MAGYTNFDRQYRLIAGQAGGVGFEIGEATSENKIPLHINFAMQKTDLESPNTGKVSVWNLNPQHLAELNKKDCTVALRAGYGNNLQLIFAGIVSHVSTVKESADERTDIEVVDNLIQLRDTYATISYEGKVSWKTILDETASQMGVAISYSYNATQKIVDVSNGFAYVGQAKNILNKACECCGLTWSIQNGVLQIKKPNDVMSKEVYVLSPDTGLIGIPAKVVLTQDEATDQNVLGWDVDYLLNGAINIDDYVKLESKEVEGYFRVYSLDLQGDNISGDWICSARLLEVTGS